MSVETTKLEAKLSELRESKAKLESNLSAHMGAIQVIEDLLKPDDTELSLPVEQESV